MCFECDVEDFAAIGLHVWQEENFTVDGIRYKLPNHWNNEQYARPMIQFLDDWTPDEYSSSGAEWLNPAYIRFDHPQPFCDVCWVSDGSTVCTGRACVGDKRATNHR